MKALIISDLHQRAIMAHNIVITDGDNVDKVIFLGDYFDNWVETDTDVKNMAEWVAANVMDKKNIFLLGNHDLSYAFPQNKATICPGYTSEKLKIIREILNESHFERMRFSYAIDGLLFSHAGVTDSLIPLGVNPFEWLKVNAEDALRKLRMSLGDDNPLLAAGWSRGGRKPYGGIFWEDHSAHLPIRGLKQIYGHSILKQPQYRLRKKESHRAFPAEALVTDEFECMVLDKQLYEYDWSLCIDTNNQHYVIVDTEQKTLTFKSTQTWQILKVQQYK